MAYSYTEKKRIRKSFAKRAAVQNVPYLLATQLESYASFLQADTLPSARANQGLQAAFNSIFPISSHSGNARLEFVQFNLGEPAFDVKECQQRGLTFASPLRARVRLVILDKEAAKETIKEVKEQEVYMGEIPLMTNNGSFVVNGTERVIVSQLHRSPGVFFEHDRGKTHSSGKLLFSAGGCTSCHATPGQDDKLRLGGGLALAAVGLVDDRRSLSARFRLLAQVAVADRLLLSKTDLLPYLAEFSPQKAEASLRNLASPAPVLHVSAKDGTGLEAWVDWLRATREEHRQSLDAGTTLLPGEHTDTHRTRDAAAPEIHFVAPSR